MMTRPLNRQYTAKPLNFKPVQCIISNTRFQDLSFGKGIGHSQDKRHFRRFDNKNQKKFSFFNNLDLLQLFSYHILKFSVFPT